MNEGMIFGQGISFPPRIGEDGRVAWSSGPQNVRESIRVILMTQLNERVMLSEFGCGLQNYLFEPNTVATRRLIEECVKLAIGRWEPRVNLESAVVEEDQQNSEAAIVTIRYQLVVNQAPDQLSLTLTFGTTNSR